MTTNNNQQIVLAGENYAITTLSLQDLQEAVYENIGSGELKPSDFDRIKVPSGGATTWSIPTIDGEIDVKAFEGVVVAWKDQKAYWQVAFDESGGGTPPDCTSEDMIFGMGNPGGDCATCPFNQFGSADKGEGKACKDIRTLLIVREGDILPIVLNVPPTSIQPLKKLFLRLVGAQTKYYDVVIKFELEKTKSKSGIQYAEVKPSVVGRIAPERRAAIKSYVDNIKPILHQVKIVDTSDYVDVSETPDTETVVENEEQQ
jgi:hypothetical protein